MKKLSLILSALLLISTMTACTSKPSQPADTTVAAEAPTNTETVLPPEDNASNKAYPSVADLVQVPDTPVTHPPIEPADYGTQPSEGLEYKLTGNYYTVVGMGTCTDAKLVIPAEYEGKPVKAIGSTAFVSYNGATQTYDPNTTVTSIVLPEGIETIEDSAFFKCHGLRNIQLPLTLKRMGQQAFDECTALVELSIPEGITEIPSFFAYYCTSLQKVVLPSTIKTIGQDAFRGCESLYEIHLPDGLETIKNGAFRGTNSLKTIHIPSSIQSISGESFRNESDVMYMKGLGEVIPEGHEHGEIRPEGWIHHMYYDGTMEQFFSLVQNESYTSPMFRFAVNFYIDGVLVEYVHIPDHITSIPAGTFSECQSLKGVSLSSELIDTEQWESAFANCPNLEWIVARGDLPTDRPVNDPAGNFDHWSSWLMYNFHAIAQPKDKKQVAVYYSTLSSRCLYVSASESQAVDYVTGYLQQSNESEIYVKVMVYYQGEWHYDENGHPTPNTD